MFSRYVVASILTASLALTAGCRPTNELVQPPPPKVTVAQPLERAVIDYFETTGYTQAVKTVELRSRVAGYLQEITFKDGDLVKEGDLLFVIEKAPYEAALAAARAELAKSEAQLKLATAQLERTRTLVERNAATRDALDVADAERASAAASLGAAKAAVTQAELNLGYTEIRAPFAGRMDRHQVDAGNIIESNTTLMATLQAVDPIHAYFNLSDRDLLRFLELERRGSEQMLSVELALGESDDFAFTGQLDFSEFGVDRGTGTTTRRAVFKNSDQRLVPGLFIRVRTAVGDPQPRLLVEERAVSSDQRGDYLLVVNEKNVVEYRAVKLGRSDAGLRVVESGIASGDWVVVNGLQRARPQTEVTPEKAEMAANLASSPKAFELLPIAVAATKDAPAVTDAK